MFQIAASHALAIDNNDRCVFPMSVEGATPNPFERLFYANTILRNITYGYDFTSIKKIYSEPGFHYNKIPYEQNLMLDGYFQSEKYFSHRRKEILALFSITDYVEERLKIYEDSGIVGSDEFVAVHIRRGDYVGLSDAHKNLAESSDYYSTAFKRFSDKKKVFFSDDIEWCRRYFGSDNVFIPGSEADVVEMFLFSRIKNKIIANSSFSWWGAWLGDNSSTVTVAPKTWFGPGNSHLITDDVIPLSWEKV
jgi:hypothetical protein